MLVLALIAACGGPAPEPAPAPAPAPAIAHEPMADHMTRMAATRDGLRAALGEAYDAPVPGLDTADPVKGKATYDTTCAPCHGAAGKGDGAAGAGLTTLPADFTDAFHARYYSDAGRVHVIEKGADGTGMPGFEAALDHQQILDVYAYVRKFREEPGDGRTDQVHP
jgi:high-affinity iron transporter